MEPTPQGQLGEEIINLQQHYPGKSAAERADILANLEKHGVSANGNGKPHIHLNWAP